VRSSLLQRVAQLERLLLATTVQVSKTQKSDTVWEAKNKRYKKNQKSRSIIPLLEYYYCCYNRRSVGRQSFDSVFVGRLLHYNIIYSSIFFNFLSHPSCALRVNGKRLKLTTITIVVIVTCRTLYTIIIIIIIIFHKTVVWRHIIRNAIK